MKKNCIIVPLAAILAGCTNAPAPTPEAQTQAVSKTTTVPKLAVTQELAKFCRVCVVDKGQKTEEFLPSRLNVQRNGLTYKFCSDPCREKFDMNAKKYGLKTSTKS